MKEIVYSYRAMGPKKERWTVADVTCPQQPLHGNQACDNKTRVTLEVLYECGFLQKAAHGYGCTSFWTIKPVIKNYGNNKATEVVLEFLKHVNLEDWRRNLPITGDFDVDIVKIKETIGQFSLHGSKWSPLLGENKSPDVGQLNYGLADAAREMVDWEEVLKLWRKE